jgi:hypothetical protein
MTHQKDDPALKCKNQCVGGFIPGHGRNKRHRRQLKSGREVERILSNWLKRAILKIDTIMR